MYETGRICMKIAGREAGRFCVVVGKDKEKDFVLVTGPRLVTKVRRRKCNVRHLEPTPLKVSIKENSNDNEVMKAYEKDEIYKRLNLQKPTPEQIKLAEEAKERHREKPKEEKHKEEKKPEKKHKEDKHKKERHEKKKEHKEKKKEHKKEKKHKEKKAPKGKAHKEKKKKSKK